jgi:hypothetical protein
MLGLTHNTIYWWNVTIDDSLGTGDIVNENYWFKTGRGGGTVPGIPTNPTPNGTTGVSITVGTFTCDVTDVDSDLLNVRDEMMALINKLKYLLTLK